MNGSIPLFGIKRQYQNLRDEILDASDRIYSSGRMLDGENTEAFENAIKTRVDRKFALTVNSCSTALLFSLLHYTRVLEYKKIVLPAISFVATTNAPLLSGYAPFFTDVDYHGLMDLHELDVSTNDINLLMYVNLCGNMIDYEKLRLTTLFFSTNQPIIEDAAQSFGARRGELHSGKAGDVSVLSFDPTKNLPNYGSGGMILTDDKELYFYALNLRDNGKSSDFASTGINSKMSESDCAQMLIKLKYFDDWQKRRTAIAEYYSDRLHSIVGVPRALPDVTHAWSKYIIRSDHRDAIRYMLQTVGIESKIPYPTPLNMLRSVSVSPIELHRAVTYCREAICLPIYPELSDSEIETIADLVAQSCISS